MITHNSAVVICEKSNFQTDCWIITRNTVVDMASLLSFAMTLTGQFLSATVVEQNSTEEGWASQ